MSKDFIVGKIVQLNDKGYTGSDLKNMLKDATFVAPIEYKAELEAKDKRIEELERRLEHDVALAHGRKKPLEKVNGDLLKMVSERDKRITELEAELKQYTDVLFSHRRLPDKDLAQDQAFLAFKLGGNEATIKRLRGLLREAKQYCSTHLLELHNRITEELKQDDGVG